MNLYLLSQDQNGGYDTYDACVVAAKSPQDARKIHPGEKEWHNEDYNPWQSPWSVWCKAPEQVTVAYLGKAKAGTKRGVILASFIAG